MTKAAFAKARTATLAVLIFAAVAIVGAQPQGGPGGGFGRPQGAGGPEGGPRGEHGVNPVQMLNQADQNKDGKISREEFTTAMDKVFQTMDKNGDGVLDESERPKRPEPTDMAAKMMERFDTNKSGDITSDEFKGPEERFIEMDRNSDGKVTTEELAQSISERQQQQPQNRSAHGNNRGAGNGPGQGADRGAIFDRLDADHDGQITTDEFRGPQERFTQMDSDGDGVLTKEEVGKAAANRQRMTGAERAEKILKRHDKNSDGKLSADEFPGDAERFAEIDTTHDGYLTAEELEQYRPERKGEGADGDSKGLPSQGRPW